LEEGAILALGFLAQQGWRRLRNLGQARLDSGRSWPEPRTAPMPKRSPTC